MSWAGGVVYAEQQSRFHGPAGASTAQLTSLTTAGRRGSGAGRGMINRPVARRIAGSSKVSKFEQRRRQPIQLTPVRLKQTLRFAGSLLQETLDLRVDHVGDCRAIRFAAAKPVQTRPRRSVPRRERHRPNRSLMPQRVTIWRARSVACCMSFSAPVVRAP